jgi:hypothetical protein
MNPAVAICQYSIYWEGTDGSITGQSFSVACVQTPKYDPLRQTEKAIINRSIFLRRACTKVPHKKSAEVLKHYKKKNSGFLSGTCEEIPSFLKEND